MPVATQVLEEFRDLFAGKRYLHRDSSLGDRVAVRLYEDLLTLGKSRRLVERVARQECVVNARNTTVGRKARRGDGTFGELVPAVAAITADGFQVARGPVANIQVGADTKILATAMIKQIDRVIGDLVRQVAQFKSTGGTPIAIAFVGINYAVCYTSYEGPDRAFPTDGGRYKHPVQEAEDAKSRLLSLARPAFDEFLLLPFRATNVAPFPFEWVDYTATDREYSALLAPGIA